MSKTDLKRKKKVGEKGEKKWGKGRKQEKRVNLRNPTLIWIDQENSDLLVSL